MVTRRLRIRVLDVKLLRDLRRLWAQTLAIALVIAGGVSTVILAVGSHHSLDETRVAYYERYNFADVFAQVRRAPNDVIGQIEKIPGVAMIEPRIAQLGLLDIANFREPATGQFISLPDKREQVLNKLYMRSGRVPERGSEREVVVNESFANAHGFVLGSRFAAILNGRKRELTIVGTALSPEFPDELAERQLDVAIDWGRYAELIDYDDRDQTLSLDPSRGKSVASSEKSP